MKTYTQTFLVAVSAVLLVSILTQVTTSKLQNLKQLNSFSLAVVTNQSIVIKIINMRTVNKLIFGAAIGAAIGILFAPNKGSITRRKLRRKGNQIKDKINDLKDVINEKIDTLKEDAEDMAMQSNGHYRK